MSVPTEFSQARENTSEHLKEAEQGLLRMSNPQTMGYEDYTDEFLDEVLTSLEIIKSLRRLID